MICYGKSIPSIAEDLNTTEEKATQIYNAVLTNLSGLKVLMDESQEMARQLGFVETKWGRRRHIPDMQLQPFEIISEGTKNFDPFFDSEELGVVDDTERLKRKYLKEISEAKYKQQKEKIKLKAEEDGFKIKENTRKIDDATRLCVNSRIQGSAADMTKIAMRLIGTSQKLKDLDFHMMLLVHDEILGECPLVNVAEAEEEFIQCMLGAAKDLRTGALVDPTKVIRWYGKEYENEDFTDLTIQNILSGAESGIKQAKKK